MPKQASTLGKKPPAPSVKRAVPLTSSARQIYFRKQTRRGQRSALPGRANTRHPNTCEPNPERFAQEERSRALRFSGNSPVGGPEYGARANQNLQPPVPIL